ncbi:MAG TPA: MFS transporter [Stellaceae bacterium]|nr:MFS transporter [Stellaceae bacterium]
MSSRSAALSLAFANVGHLFTHMLMLLYPTVVLALEGRYGLTYGELLALSMPGFVLYGVAALPMGWLGDRWSAEYMIVIYFLGSGAAAIGTGLADGPVGLAIGLTALGLFGSIYHPVGVAWLVRNAVNRGRVLGWNGIFGSLGVGVASFVAGGLTELWSWRAAFIVPGACCAALGVGLLFLVRGRHVVALKTDRKPVPEPERSDIRRVFIVLSITMLCAGIMWQMLTVALPKLFELRLTDLIGGGGTAATGRLVSLVFLVSAGVTIVGGLLADRYPLKQVYLWAWVAQVPVLIVLINATQLPLLGLMMLLFSLEVMTGPAENSLLVRYTPGRWRATAFGAKFVLAQGVSALGVPLVGYVFDMTGDFLWMFGILIALTVAIVAATIYLPREPGKYATPAVVPAE